MWRNKIFIHFLLICVKSAFTYNIESSEAKFSVIRPYEDASNEELQNPIYFGFGMEIKRGINGRYAVTKIKFQLKLGKYQ